MAVVSSFALGTSCSHVLWRHPGKHVMAAPLTLGDVRIFPMLKSV